ncbi:MAG: HIRAN domain-containing protein [Methanobrevibacter sp.]|jgi:hypothetical protein|nr:HIRAN domain-containing protein [Candidatus Methanovirga australis]
MGQNYVTITGMDYYEDVFSFDIGEIIRLKKEPNNSYDAEAIKAEIPFTGKIGYVANSSKTVVKGTMSAGRIYDKIEENSYVKIIFITNKELICEFLDNEKSENEIKAIESLFEKWGEEESVEEDLVMDNNFLMDKEEKDFGGIEGHVFEVDLRNDSLNRVSPAIKNKLLDLILNSVQLKYEPSDTELFDGEEVNFNLKSSNNVKNDMNKISHDEIAIFMHKKEGLINKYFELKEKILDIDDLVDYKINDKQGNFFYNDKLFALLSIEENYISISIKSDAKLEISGDFTEVMDKNSYLYEFNLDEEADFKDLIGFIRSVLLIDNN